MKVVIIGANRGIGFELAKQYREKGYDVVATCRKTNDALKSLKVTVVEGVDTAEDSLVESLSAKIPFETIDILIHSAGILQSDRFPEIDLDNMRQSFEVNTLGPLRTALALKNKLRSGSKFGIITSRVGSIDDNSSSNNYAYRTSKTAVNMVGKCLSLDLKDQGIAVALLHPGYVKTDMTGHNGLIEPSESAEGLILRMEELSLETSGIFVHTSGEILTW